MIVQIPPDVLSGLALGDVIELGQMFPGLSVEPIVLRVTGVEKGRYTVEASWLGARLTDYVLRTSEVTSATHMEEL